MFFPFHFCVLFANLYSQILIILIFFLDSFSTYMSTFIQRYGAYTAQLRVAQFIYKPINQSTNQLIASRGFIN